MRKYIVLVTLVMYLIWTFGGLYSPLISNSSAAPWTREKAAHLARATLFYADPQIVDRLYAAGSAGAAVDILFPSITGPDRSGYDQALMNYTSSGFNWADQNHVARLYNMKYALDPYEAKRKLFSLFEDIYAVSANGDISYRAIHDQQELLYSRMFGNYQLLVKRLLYNNGQPGDYAEGMFLDLFNQNDPRNPNENYARELLQLFMMGEYEPGETEANGDTRNYEETDVKALARLLTGFQADKLTNLVTGFDITKHYTGSVVFLTGSLPESFNPPYYNALSGTLNGALIVNPQNGNNGLSDNVIEYIFAKRSPQIALFLADRIYRFYIADNPTRSELDTIASIILANNFEMYPSIKMILTLDMLYTDASMNAVKFKNPLELYIGSLKKFRNNSMTGVLADPILYRTDILPRLNWVPYVAGSVFGRDGFDDSRKWINSSIQNGWISLTNNFVYQNTGTGSIGFLSLLPQYRKELTSEVIPVQTHAYNSYSGTLTIASGIFTVDMGGSSNVIQSDNLVQQIQSFSQTASSENPVDLTGESVDLSESPIMDNFSEPYQIELKQEYSYSDTYSIDTETSDSIEVQEIIDPALTSTGIDMLSSSGENSEGAVRSDSQDTINQPSISDTASGEVLSGSGEPLNQKVEQTVEILSLESASEGEVSIPVREEIPSLTETTPPIDPENVLVQTGEVSDVGLENLPEVSTGVLTGASESFPVEGVQVQKEEATTSVSPALVEPSAISLTAVTGRVILPTFTLQTNSGNITIHSGSYDALTKTLRVYSGSIMMGTGTYRVTDGTFVFTQDSRITVDNISPETIYDAFEKFVLDDRPLPPDVRSDAIRFMTTDMSGSTIPVAPSNTAYYNQIMKGVISFMMTQPEYVLLNGANASSSTNTSEQRLLDTAAGKIIFIELYGGNDYLASIAPKDEYNYYRDVRTRGTGSIAISGTGMVDIGDFYMNSALAYSSTGAPTFKALYDNGYLKLFNRVGTRFHSFDHNQAALQISSHNSSVDESAAGAFGKLVEKEFNSLNTISLGARNPNIYRSGKYVNMGGSIIVNNFVDSQSTRHIALISRSSKTRSYPGDTGDMFRNAIAISDVGRLSVSQGGPGGATGDMNSVFNFLKRLLANDVGRSFYMGGRGGYDTHGGQFNPLNSNLQFVADSVTRFFNEVKDTQDVTIVIFSEFGRTIFMNGDMGTDHGNGGGMYVISSNKNLLSSLPSSTYGNMSIQNARGNYLGVGIDYRSVYSKIYNSLYGIDGPTFFQDQSIGLEKDISTEKNSISLLSVTYGTTNPQNMSLNVSFSVTGSNYDPAKASHTRLLAGTGVESLQNVGNEIRNNYQSGYYLHNYRLTLSRHPHYKIGSYSNQYTPVEIQSDFLGDNLPTLYGSTVRQISHTGSSVMMAWNFTPYPGILRGSGFVLNDSLTPKTITLPKESFEIQFSSGLTAGVDLVASGVRPAQWFGGFLLGESINPDTFFPVSAILTTENTRIPKSSILRINKLGTDQIGVGMNLNQPVSISFTNLVGTGGYRVITSDNGIDWKDVESNGMKYSPNSEGKITVSTNHLGYFALMSDTIVTLFPSCTASISPNSIANGTSTTFTWSIANSLTGLLTPGNIILGTNGSRSITPPDNATTVYTLTTSNAAGTSSCTAQVTTAVIALPPIPPPTCSIASNPSSVTNGSTTQLSWSISNATGGTLNPGNISVTSLGTRIVTPPSDTTTVYTLSATNSGGTTTCQTQVRASATSVTPPPPNPPIGNTGSSNSNGSITGPGGGGGGSSYSVPNPIGSSTSNTQKSLDMCLGGDTSGDTMDGYCTLSEKRGSKNTPKNLENNVTPSRDKSSQESVLTILDDVSLDSLSRTEIVSLSEKFWADILAQPVESRIAYRDQVVRALDQYSTDLSVEAQESLDMITYYVKVMNITSPVQSNTQPNTEISEPVLEKLGTRYIDAENSLIFRSTPEFLPNNIRSYLSRNTPILVLGTEGEWSHIVYDTVDGYVRTAYLRDWKLEDDIRRGLLSPDHANKGYITVKHSLYVRSAPSIFTQIRGVVYNGQPVMILDRVGNWVEISTPTFRGYIHQGYLSVSK